MPITRGQETKQVTTMARGLYDNINARKKAGTSRSKSESTISPAAYKNMQEGFPMKDRKKKMGGGSMMESPRKAMAMGGYGESTKRKKMRYGGDAGSKIVKGPCS